MPTQENSENHPKVKSGSQPVHRGGFRWFSRTGAAVTKRYQPAVSAVFQFRFVDRIHSDWQTHWGGVLCDRDINVTENDCEGTPSRLRLMLSAFLRSNLFIYRPARDSAGFQIRGDERGLRRSNRPAAPRFEVAILKIGPNSPFSGNGSRDRPYGCSVSEGDRFKCSRHT